MAVSLFPYKFLTEYSEELQRKFVLSAVLTATALDVGATYISGNLFEPWYYLGLIFYLVFFTALPLVFSSPVVMRACGWILAISLLSWSVIVRSFLVS